MATKAGGTHPTGMHSCLTVVSSYFVQVITYGSIVIGVLFLSGWNIISLFVEYFFLYKVYHSVPELASKNKINEK